MRGRLEEDPAFTAVTVESERIRLFNEHISSLEVRDKFLLFFCSLSALVFLAILSSVLLCSDPVCLALFPFHVYCKGQSTVSL